MIKNDSSHTFFNGLEEDKQTQNNSIVILQCVRWVMKKHKMDIEIKHNKSPDNTLIIQLSKYDGNKLVDTKFETDITDYRVERGLFELERAVMDAACIKPAHGIDTILEVLQKNKFPLPPHDDLRKEVVQGNHTIRVNYLGTDPTSKRDLWGGSLFFKNELVVSCEPQKQMRYILDYLEIALLQKKREEYRKGMNDIINALNNPSDNKPA